MQLFLIVKEILSATKVTGEIAYWMVEGFKKIRLDQID